MALLTVLIVGVTLASLAFTWICQVCTLALRRRKTLAEHAPPISVLKPLKGADAELYDNLVALARQDYPCFELVFACEEINDPALEVVQRLKRDFPDVDITIVAGGKPIGFNPKVNNLHQAATAARYAHFLISDADIRARPSYLRELAAELADPRVALVSNPITGVGERSVGSSFDNLHLNTFVISSVCSSEVLAGHALVVGKSMLVDRVAFERVGGWNAIKNVLAEDYVLGQLFQKAGYRVVLSSHVIRAVNRSRGVTDFFARHVRWAQMQRNLARFLYWFEPFMMPGGWLLAALFALALEPDGPKMTLWSWALTLLIGVKALVDAAFVRTVRGQWPNLVGLLALPFKDLFVLAIWVCAAVRTTVCWRGNYFKIGAGSVLTPLSEESSGEEVVALRF